MPTVPHHPVSALELTLTMHLSHEKKTQLWVGGLTYPHGLKSAKKSHNFPKNGLKLTKIGVKLAKIGQDLPAPKISLKVP